MRRSNCALGAQLVPQQPTSSIELVAHKPSSLASRLATGSPVVTALKFRPNKTHSQKPVTRCSMCSYGPALVISLFVKLALVHFMADLLSKHVQLHHGVNAFLRGPRFVGPAAYYFQLPAERRRSPDHEAKPTDTGRFDWLRQLDDIPVADPGEPNGGTMQPAEFHGVTRKSPAAPCSGSVAPGDCQEANRNVAITDDNSKREVAEDAKRQIIERYKTIILNQMNLDHIPDHPPITENATSWKALPLILQNKLKAEVDTSNQVMDDPVVEDEEKESFIMLKEYPLELDSIPSMAFVLKIADDIDPNHVKEVWIHVEHTDDLPSGTKMTLWEIAPTLSISDSATDEPSFNNISPEQYQNTGMFPDTNDDDDDVTRAITDVLGASPTSSRTFRLIRPRIASARVRNSVRGNSTKFDVTGKLINWLKHRKRARRNGPIVRYLMLVCPSCENFQLVDPKKVVMEISYRQALRRRRRSLNGTEDGLTNSCQDDGQQFTCCTQPLKIQFSEIGWDRWIIHPKKFEPNFCRGSCQVNGFQSTHYEVLNLLSHKNLTQLREVPRGSIQSCCYPTRRTTFTLLYLDRNKDVRMHTLHNLIVLGCGCS